TPTESPELLDADARAALALAPGAGAPPSADPCAEDEDDAVALGADVDFADPNSPLAPLYLRTSHVVAALFLGTVFVLLSHLRVWHTDVWAHLRFGQEMVQTGRLPDRETFAESFADHEAPYINYQWLAQAGASLVFDLGQHLAAPDPEH